MMRPYGAQSRLGGHNPLGVGVIAVGSIYYLQNEANFRERYGGRAICRNPWQITSFSNGMLHASRRNRDTGLWESSFRSGRSDLAVVRSLRDGRQRTIAVRLLQLHDELGLTKGITRYPTLPDLRFYRCRPRTAEPAPVREQAA